MKSFLDRKLNEYISSLEDLTLKPCVDPTDRHKRSIILCNLAAAEYGKLELFYSLDKIEDDLIY